MPKFKNTTKSNIDLIYNGRKIRIPTGGIIEGPPHLKMYKGLELYTEAMQMVTSPQAPKIDISENINLSNIEEINKSDPNFIVSIYLTEHDCYKTGSSVFMVGLCAIDLSTGQNIIYQGSVNSYDKNALLEDIYRFIESNNPKRKP